MSNQLSKTENAALDAELKNIKKSKRRGLKGFLMGFEAVRNFVKLLKLLEGAVLMAWGSYSAWQAYYNMTEQPMRMFQFIAGATTLLVGFTIIWKLIKENK